MEGGKSIFKKLKKQETSSTSSTNIYITEKEKNPGEYALIILTGTKRSFKENFCL